VDLQPVGPEHDVDLAGFTCAAGDDGYSAQVQRDIRTAIAEELAAGYSKALGSWDRSELAAIIVYTTTNPFWTVPILATDLRYRRHKQAERLKREVVRRAAAAGAAALVSRVHRDNYAMLALNRKLGAAVDFPDDGDNPFIVCTIRTQRR
jgi:ribosomal protein S18 acetylase RimI-like enzyme